MKTLALVLLVIAILVIFMTIRPKARARGNGSSKNNKTHISKDTSIETRHSFRATSIIADTSACEAAKALGKKKFLDVDRDVPVLPLGDCTVSRCNCRYAHHDDRRDFSEDRRGPPGLKSQLYDVSDQQDKRGRTRGRRKDDLA